MPNNSSEQSSFPPKRKRFQGKFVSLSSELLWASPTFSPFVMCCAGAKCNIRSCTEGAIEWRFLGAISTFHDASVPCKASNASGVMEIRVIWQWKQNSKGSRRLQYYDYSAILLNSLYRLQLGRCQLHSSSNINLFLFVFVPKCLVQIQLIALACLDSLVPCEFAFRHSMASLSRLEDKKRCGLCGERTWFWKLFRWKTRTPAAFQRFLSKMQQIQSTRRYIRYIQLQFFTYIKLQCISLYNMHESMKNDEKWIFARQAASNLKDFHFDCFEMGRATAIGDAVKLFSKRTPVRLSWTKWRRLWILVVKWLIRFSRRFETARTVRSWSWCTDVPTRNSRGFARNWVKGLWKSWSYGRTSGVCEFSWKHKD